MLIPHRTELNISPLCVYSDMAAAANLKKLAKSGWVAYPEEARSAWVLKQPAQLVIAISQVYWCHGVEDALRSEDPMGALGDYRVVSVVTSSCL